MIIAIHRGVEFLVDCKELSFAFGKVEPFFCSLVLVDIRTRQRVSETFHFDLNTDKLAKLAPHRLVASLTRLGECKVQCYLITAPFRQTRPKVRRWIVKRARLGHYSALVLSHRIHPASTSCFASSRLRDAILIVLSIHTLNTPLYIP